MGVVMNAATTFAESNEAAARRLLRRTWHPFFARFGRITGTQAAAIAPVYSGADILLSAPTATGKTEAVCAPAIERLLEEPGDEATPALMLVAPTRALCNDLTRRLEPPVRRSALRVDVKTGDSPRLSTSAPPHVLVTTPESLDSMLCRRTRFLRSLKTVVFDELHLLDGGARGDQLKSLSSRLARVAPGVQRCATSATIPRVEDVAREYLGASARVVRTDCGQRRLDCEYVPIVTRQDIAIRLRELHAREPGSKILVFVNRRSDVEWLSGQLRDLGALGHHGSLSRDRRLQVERRFLNAPSGCCVATMTLEVGVDIGDIDRVVLAAPPADVASFRQRIGRANRRGGRIKVSMLHRGDRERARFEHMVACTQQGLLFGETIAFRPALVAQQAISLMFQNPSRWVSAEALHDRLPESARAEIDVDDCGRILAALEDEGWLYSDSIGRFNPGDRAEKSFEYGGMHANISPNGDVDVVDEMTRRVVGRVSGKYLHKPEGFAIAGQRRKVSRVRESTVFVEGSEGTDDVTFAPNGSPRLTFDYCQSLARHCDVPERTIRCRLGEDAAWLVEHWFGTIWGEVLAGVLVAQGYRTKKVGPFSLVAIGGGGGPRGYASKDAALRVTGRSIRSRLRRLASKLEPGPFDAYVPDDLRLEWVRRCVDVDAFAGHLAACRIACVEDR
jgi:ATP-dependent Lhr-like helicase